MRRKGMAAMRIFSVFMAIVMVVLSAPLTALAAEVKVMESPQTMAEISEETSRVKEETEENQTPEETPEEDSGETSEKKEDSENGEGTDNDSEGDAETGESSADGSDETPDGEENPDADAETDADTEADADDEPETDQETEEEIEEPVEEKVSEEKESAKGRMAVGDTLEIDYDNYSLKFIIKSNLNDYYASVTGFGSGGLTGDTLTIPSYVSEGNDGERLPVKDIGKEAFSGNTGIIKLCFEDDPQLVSIQNNAFKNCKNLAYIELPDSIESIGKQAFYGNTVLGTRDKNGANITERQLVLPNRLKSLGSEAFRDCDALKSVCVPATLDTMSESINYGPFYQCDNLSEITIEDGMKTIPAYLFYGDIRPLDKDLNGELLKPVTFNIPGSVTSIGRGAFQNQGSMTRFEISGDSQLKTIGRAAFEGCKNLKYAELPDSITSISPRAFSGDTKLGTQTQKGERDDAPQLVLPNALESLGATAFQDCDALVKVVVPATLNTVPDDALTYYGPFYQCDKLSEITIEDGMKTIPAHLFDGRIGSLEKDDNGELLKPVTFNIPDSVTAIGRGAFQDQENMTRFEISGDSQLKKIEKSAFEGCKNLKYAELPDSITSISPRAFMGDTKLGTQTQKGERDDAPQLVLPSGLESLGAKAFQDCDALVKVVVPATLNTVPDDTLSYGGAFSLCDKLSEITIEDGMKTIPAYLFDGRIRPLDKDDNGELLYPTTFNIPDSVTEIGRAAFRDQGSMTRFEISGDSQLKTIGTSAFEGCTNLEYAELPDSITSIGASAFKGDVKLGTQDKEGNPAETPELKFPVQLTSLGDSAFSSCKSLQNIEFEVNNYYTTKQTLGKGVFKDCTSLKTIKFGNKIQAIPDETFYGCTALEELEISYGVKSIGTNVFYNCHELKYLFIPSSVTTIKTTQSELAFCYEQGLKIYVEKGESAAVTWADKIGFKTEVGIYRTREEFPDEAFFLEMNTQRFDKNLDTCLTLRELEQIGTLELSKLGIEDMTGIQILTYVESLNCSDNRITVLDTSALTLLKTLNCANNKISVLDVSKNPLETLNCENNAILVIDLSGIATLKDVTLGKQAGSLAINYDSAYGEYVLPLKETYSAYNKACISELSDEDVKKPTNNGLVWYEAYDVPDNISYKYTTGYGSGSGQAMANVHVTITNAGITLTDKEYPDVAFRGKVMELVDANKNGLISKTEERSCSELQISGADISDLTGLERLSSLRILNCADNHLTMLDISRNPAIEVLDCSKNDLKALNTRSNLSLKELTCTDNKITRLDTSQNTLLEILECGNNRIAAIETANNQHLDTLRSGNQQITVVKAVSGDSAYIDMKAYDESFDYAKVTGITMYLDNAAIKDADAKISGDGIVVPDYVEQISYQYSIPGFREMYVTVKLVEKLEEEPEEEPARNISTLTISAFTDKIYTGEETTQVITIYDGLYRLKVYKDYTVAYENNTEVGTASVTIKGIGKYIGTYTGNYEIKPEWREISIKNIPDQVYQNKEITPAFTVKLGKKILVKDIDFVADYSNNKDAGVATIVITGMGQYESAGMREISFNIVECNISKVSFLPITDEIYDGTAKVPVPVVRHNGLLRAGIDYTTSYSKNIKAGKGVITFKGIGNYTGSVNKTFTIKKYDLSKLTDEEIIVEQKVPFSMTGARAAVEIRTSSGITLTEGTDYTLSYSGNKKAGVTNAKVVIKGKGSCSGKKTMTFEVMPQDLNDAALQIKIAVAQKDSQGRPVKPNITITQNKKKLREGENKDYTVAYNAEDTVRSGKVTVTITGKNNYGGETTADFIIVDKLITKAKIKGVENYEYSGDEIEQSENDITVMLGNEEVPANCYDISYDQNIESGNKAVMTVTATPETCNYEFGGSVSAKFKITPVKFALSKTENRVEASLAKSSIVYNGQKQSPDVIVTDEVTNIVLKKDVDYVASYSNNQNVGTNGKVTIKGKGNYSGTIVVPFSIEAKNMTEYEDDFTVIMRNSAYTGKVISPRITVMDGDTVLKLNKDYKLEIERDDPNGFDGKIKNKGRYTITIKGAGGYTGELLEHNLYVY